MKRNRGQAALEFLMTYSWALIMVLILIAAIYYFGVTKPKDLLPNRCLFSPEIECLSYSLSSADNAFRLKLKNNAGDMITVTAINLNNEGSTSLACTKPSNPTNWVHGGSQDLVFTNCNLGSTGFNPGKTAKLFINLSFYPFQGGPSYVRNVQGEIITKVS